MASADALAPSVAGGRIDYEPKRARAAPPFAWKILRRAPTHEVMPWPKVRWASCSALCVLAHACSLELPSTGPGLDLGPATHGAVDAPEPGTVVNERGQDAAVADARASSPSPIDTDAGDSPATNALADAAADAAEPDGGPAAPTRCALDGSYALRVAFDVSWVGTEFASIVPIIDKGQGELSFTMLMELTSRGDELNSRLRTCSAEVPEFAATISRERYQAHFADAVWDAPSMPTFTTALRTECGTPGCALRGDVYHALIGAALPTPDAPWPRDVGDAGWPDHDGDGVPGIAVTMLGKSPYDYPPLDLLSLRRVPSLGLGLRVSVGFDGQLESCDAVMGNTVAGRVETRAVSCRTLPAPEACQQSELQFLNENLPVWTVREGTFEAKRLGKSADCQAVRRAFH